MARVIEARLMGSEEARLLFEAWVKRFARDVLGLEGGHTGLVAGTRTVVYGGSPGAYFSVKESGLEVTLHASMDVDEEAALQIIDAALAKVAAHDFGGVVVYQTELAVQEFNLLSPMHFMRTLGDQRHIEGPHRLSGVALLDFEEGSLATARPPEFLFLPSARVQVTLFIGGPIESQYTATAVAGVTEAIAAVCAFAAGRPVTFAIPAFALDDDASRIALERQADQSIPTLQRDAVSLDLFGDLAMIGGADAVWRARGSFLAYHAALDQTSPDVAVMLLVTSMEALIAPRASWGKSRVTTRFIKAIIDLCPDAVDRIIQHNNVGEAFRYVKKGGIAKQRNDILELIYEARSIPSHTGLSLSRSGIFDMASGGSMRVALLSDLAQAALLSFLQAPRSFVIGNPAFDPQENG